MFEVQMCNYTYAQCFLLHSFTVCTTDVTLSLALHRAGAAAVWMLYGTETLTEDVGFLNLFHPQNNFFFFDKHVGCNYEFVALAVCSTLLNFPMSLHIYIDPWKLFRLDELTNSTPL